MPNVRESEKSGKNKIGDFQSQAGKINQGFFSPV
jgi:hypothetical protein